MAKVMGETSPDGTTVIVERVADSYGGGVIGTRGYGERENVACNALASVVGTIPFGEPVLLQAGK
jgi:hypothetical protein